MRLYLGHLPELPERPAGLQLAEGAAERAHGRRRPVERRRRQRHLLVVVEDRSKLF